MCIQLLGKTLKPSGQIYILPPLGPGGKNGNILHAYNSQDKDKKHMKSFKKYNIYTYYYDIKRKTYHIDCSKVTSKSKEYIFMFKSKNNLLLMCYKYLDKLYNIQIKNIFSINDKIVKDINKYYKSQCSYIPYISGDVFSKIGQYTSPSQLRMVSKRIKKVIDPTYLPKKRFDVRRLYNKYGDEWIKDNDKYIKHYSEEWFKKNVIDKIREDNFKRSGKDYELINVLYKNKYIKSPITKKYLYELVEDGEFDIVNILLYHVHDIKNMLSNEEFIYNFPSEGDWVEEGNMVYIAILLGTVSSIDPIHYKSLTYKNIKKTIDDVTSLLIFFDKDTSGYIWNKDENEYHEDIGYMINDIHSSIDSLYGLKLIPEDMRDKLKMIPRKYRPN